MTGSLFFGLKDGQAMVKMMLDAGDDYFSTPNTDYAKFAFNSETSLIAYVDQYRRVAWGGPTLYPRSGTDGTSYDAGNGWFVRAGTSFEWWLFDGRGATDGAFIPMVESKPILRTGFPDFFKVINHVLYRRLEADFFGGTTRSNYDVCVQNSFGVGNVDETNPLNPASNLVAKFEGSSNLMRMSPREVGNSSQWTSTYQADAIAAVWDLPMDETPLEVPTGPDSGEILRIVATPTLFRMSRDGYDATDASGRELLLDGSRNPAKIVATGEVTIAAGATADVMIPEDLQPLSLFTFVDTNIRFSDDPFYLPGRITRSAVYTADGFYALTYRSITDRIRFFNEIGEALTVRYVVYALDNQAPSNVGTNDVLRISDEAIQILRPGAGTPPRFSEIILDSRMTYLPIVAEGFIPRSSFGATDNSDIGSHMAQIDFTNTGFTPFLKYSVKFQFNAASAPSYYMPIGYRLAAVPTPPNIANGSHTAYSSAARIEDDHIRFYANLNAPASGGWTGTSSGTGAQYLLTYPASGYGFMGVRYYVFAIPNAL